MTHTFPQDRSHYELQFSEMMAAYRKHCYQAGINWDGQFLVDALKVLPEGGSDVIKEAVESVTSTKAFSEIPAVEWFIIDTDFSFDAKLSPITSTEQAFADDAHKASGSSAPVPAIAVHVDFAYRFQNTLHIIVDRLGDDTPQMDLEFLSYLLPIAIEPIKMGGTWYVDARYHMIPEGKVVRPSSRATGLSTPFRLDQMGSIGAKIREFIKSGSYGDPGPVTREVWTCKDSRRLAKLLLSFGVSEEDLWSSLDLSRNQLGILSARYNLEARMPFLKRCYEVREEQTDELKPNF